MTDRFELVCSWTQDESENSKCFFDSSHWGLYLASPPNCVGQRYIRSTDIGCGGQWISDEEAAELIRKHSA